MNRRRLCAGLDVSPTMAHIAIVESRAGSPPRLVAARTVQFTAAERVESVARALRDLGASGKDCFVSWAPEGEPVAHRVIDAPALRGPEQLAYVKRLIQKEDPALVEGDLRWELQELGPGRIGEYAGVELLTVRSDRARLAELSALARSLPVRVRLATTAPLGLSRVAALLPKEGAEGGGAIALASVAFHRVTLAVLDGGRVRLVREFDASLLVESGSQRDPAAAARIADEIARTVRYFEQNNHPRAVDRLVLCGDSSLSDRAAENLRQLVHGPVLRLSRLVRAELVVAPEAEAALDAAAIAVGMALGDDGPRVPNLLPARERFRRERRAIAAAALLALAAAAAAALPLRQRAMGAAQAAEARLAAAESTYRVEAERRLAADEATRALQWAAQWRSLFDTAAESHDRWAQLAVGLANVAPRALVFSKLEAIRHGAGYSVSVDSQMTGNDPALLEQQFREFATHVRALPHVKELVIAPIDSRPETVQKAGLHPKVSFEFDNPPPFAPAAPGPMGAPEMER